MNRPDFPVERAAFARLRTSLLPEHEGEFVVLFGTELVAVTRTLQEALVHGFARATAPIFFVARITTAEEVVRVPAELLWATVEA